MYGRVSNRVLEEESFHRGRPHRFEPRQQQQQPAETSRLAGMAGTDVVAKDALRLVLQHLHWMNINQAARVCGGPGGRGEAEGGTGRKEGRGEERGKRWRLTG